MNVQELMETDQPNISQSKPNSKGDLKSLPMQELQMRLESSPDGLSQIEAEKRLNQY
jgi:H+-transporting ATPase